MRFPHKFLNSLALNLTDSVKKGDFPDQSQSFRFFARSHQNKLRHYWTGLAIITWLVCGQQEGLRQSKQVKVGGHILYLQTRPRVKKRFANAERQETKIVVWHLGERAIRVKQARVGATQVRIR